MTTKTVWKYPLDPSDNTHVVMPAGAELLHVEEQGAEVCLWALVDPDAPVMTRRLRIAGTGHVLDGDVGPHVGSFQLLSGRLVFHVFDEGEIDG